MMLKIAIASIHSMIRKGVVFFIFGALALFFWLLSGITLQHIRLNNLLISQLYIKLDKKLTLIASDITVDETLGKTDQSINPQATIAHMRHWFAYLDYFDHIEIKNINTPMGAYTLRFDGNTFFLQGEQIDANTSMQITNGAIRFDTLSLRYLPLDLNLFASLRYEMDQGSLYGNGKITIEQSGDAMFKLDANEQNATLQLFKGRFRTLDTIIGKIDMPLEAKEWALHRVRSKEIVLPSLKLKAFRNDKGWFVDTQSVVFRALFHDATIAFHPDLPPVHADFITMHYIDGRIDFELDKPTYLKRDLDGSHIRLITQGANPAAYVSLRINAPIDKEVQRILQAYNLDIPVYFQGKNGALSIDLKIPFDKQPIDASVDVKLHNGVLRHKGLVLPIQRGYFHYDTNRTRSLFADVDVSKGILSYRSNLKLPVKQGRLVYRNETVKIKDLVIQMPKLKTSLNGLLNLKTQKLQSKASIQHFRISNDLGSSAFEINNQTFTVNLSYDKDRFWMQIPALKLTINNSQAYELHAQSLRTLKPYLRHMPVDFDDGVLKVKTNDFLTYRFKGRVKDRGCFFYADKNCFSVIPFWGRWDSQNGLELKAFKGKLHYQSNLHTVRLNRLHIDLHKLLQSGIASSQAVSYADAKPLRLIGFQSDIRYERYRLTTDSYNVQIFPNGDLNATATSHGKPIYFTKKANRYKLDAYQITDKTIASLLPYVGLSGGAYTIHLEGDPDTLMRAKVYIKGGTFRSKAFHTTANVVESLPVSKKAGIAMQSFAIKQGTIEFSRTPKKLTFRTIHVKGDNKSIIGKGYIDLEKKKLHIDLAVHVAKDLGKIVGSLPIVGYILMGKDKSISIGLKVRGSIDTPVVQTTAAKDILLLPFKLIKRTLESPLQLLEDDTQSKQDIWSQF